MGIKATRLRARSWKCGALQAAMIIAVSAGCRASSANDANAPVPAARADVAQSTSEDPCRYVTAQEMGKAFGRPMKSSKLVNVCRYRGTESDLVVVKVETGSEGNIMRYARGASAQGQKTTEKVPTAAGEAYFESILPAFIGRVGNHEVQIETTIQPVPREAMIAVGLRIMETLNRQVIASWLLLRRGCWSDLLQMRLAGPMGFGVTRCVTGERAMRLLHLPRLTAAAIAASAVLVACRHPEPPPPPPPPAHAAGSPRLLSVADLTPAERQYGHSASRSAAVTYQPDVVIPPASASAVRALSADGLIWTIDPAAIGAGEIVQGKVLLLTSRAAGGCSSRRPPTGCASSWVRSKSPTSSATDSSRWASHGRHAGPPVRALRNSIHRCRSRRSSVRPACRTARVSDTPLHRGSRPGDGAPVLGASVCRQQRRRRAHRIGRRRRAIPG